MLLPPDAVLMTRATPKMRETAQAFEAQALSQLLGHVFATLGEPAGPFSGGQAEGQWRPMLVEAMAKDMARAGGVGLARPVLTEMLRIQAARENTT
jgi:Rod binding domain-containing protein